MKKLLILTIMVITLFTLVGCNKSYKVDDSSWTAYSFLKDGKKMTRDEYLDSYQTDTVKVINNIEFNGNNATLSEWTIANKDGITIGTTHNMDKGSANIKQKKAQIKGTSDKYNIDGNEYAFDENEDIIKGTFDDTTITYIRDYGVKGKIFTVDKIYKNGKLVYDIDKETDSDEDMLLEYTKNAEGESKLTSYEFTKDSGYAMEYGAGEKKFDITCVDGEKPEIKITYDDKSAETAIYDRKTKTLTIDNGVIKRVFTAGAGTPLED